MLVGWLDVGMLTRKMLSTALQFREADSCGKRVVTELNIVCYLRLGNRAATLDEGCGNILSNLNTRRQRWRRIAIILRCANYFRQLWIDFGGLGIVMMQDGIDKRR